MNNRKVGLSTAVALLLVALTVNGLALTPSWGQLPPTNMGKFVKQPGDNQYTPGTQMSRHGTTYFDTNGGEHVYVKPANQPLPTPARSSGSGSSSSSSSFSVSSVPMGGSQSTGPKIDVSLEPISADEPIPPAGFPPLPLRLDLPAVATGVGGASTSWLGSSSSAAASGGGGGGSKVTGYHQHYAHYEPGAFLGGGRSNGTGGGGGGGAPAPAAPPDSSAVPGVSATPNANESSIGGYTAQGPKVQYAKGTQGGVGYYKCKDATAPIVTRTTGDSFNTNTPGVTPPQYGGVSGKDIQKLGRAPELNEKDDAAGAPEAPTPVLTSQSTTQDLSLPDDNNISRHFNDSKGKRFMNRVGRTTYRAGRSVLRRASGAAGIGF